MSSDEQMQTEAFCLETESIETAQSARLHHKDTFYCTEEVCLIEVNPAKRKNFFFRARVGSSHHPNCCYYKEPKEDNGPGDPKPRPTPDPLPFVPTHLGPIKRKRRLGKPTRSELLSLIAGAKCKPILVPGTLEQVVSAWNFMTDAERASSPLSIEGIFTNYKKAFLFMGSCDGSAGSVEWSSKILHGRVEISGGKVPGYIFANCIKKFSCGGERLSPSLTIRPLDYQGHADKAYISDIITPTLGTLFWHGSEPQIFRIKGKNRLKFIIPDDARYYGFALR